DQCESATLTHETSPYPVNMGICANCTDVPLDYPVKPVWKDEKDGRETGDDKQLSAGKRLPKLLARDGYEITAHPQEIPGELSCSGGKRTALYIFPTNLGLDQALAESVLRAFNTAPDVAIALAEVLSSPLDGTGLFDGLKNLGDPESEHVTAS